MKYSVGPAWPTIVGAIAKSVIASALVLSLPLPAQAGFWGFERRFGDRDNVSHDEIVQVIYQSTTPPTADGPTGEVTEEPTETPDIPLGRNQLYESLFEPPAVKMPFRLVQETGPWQEDPTREVLQSGTMYYSEGELFVLDETSDAQAASGSRNVATVEGNLYTWETGATTGEILTRFTGDTVELVDYLIDPTLIKYSFFNQYREAPEKFTVTEREGVIDLQPNEIPYGFGGIRLTTNPLWISTIVMYECATDMCEGIDPTQKRTLLEVDEPIPLDEIPADVQILPEGVTFTPSEATADRFMTYL